MDEKPQVRCKKCGKIITGVSLDYMMGWLCSECAEDKTDVLHCERGSKVCAVRLDAGFDTDSQKAHELLTEGRVYEVESLNIGDWVSYVVLKEIPNQRFNTVHFDRCG